MQHLIGQRSIQLEVDGGINLATAPQCVQNGATALVAGSAIFKAQEPAQIIQKLKQAGEK